MQSTPSKTSNTTSKDKVPSKVLETLPDGLELEGYGEGGFVQIVNTDRIQWARDILPHFLSFYTIVAVHFFYYFTGNLALPLFLSQCQTLYAHLSGGARYQDRQNIGRKSERAFFNDKRFYLPLWFTIGGGTLTWIWALCVFSDDVHFGIYYLDTVRPRTWPQFLMLMYCLAFISSMQSNACHELLHKRELYNKALAMFGFLPIHNLHFPEEHVMHHHKLLGTYDDPETSRLNESLYWYIVRGFYLTAKHTLQREYARIRKQHGSDCPLIAYIILNKMTWYCLIYICKYAAIYQLLGWNSLRFHFIFSAWGLWWLGFANYVTHYGLIRKKDKNGLYESINKYHSWNCYTSPLYYRLFRHSDHHEAAFRPYQILRRFDDAPWNPYTMVICLYLVQIPPLWYWVYNPRV